jgi:hypothetical protein
MDEQAPRIDLTDSGTQDSYRGSAWATLDENFFRLVHDAFSHEFCFGAAVLLASNDDTVIELPRPRTEAAPLSHAETIERLNAEIDAELALRRAMRRHPSNRRRF